VCHLINSSLNNQPYPALHLHHCHQQLWYWKRMEDQNHKTSIYNRGARTKNYMCSRKGNRQCKSTAGNGATHWRDGGHFPVQTNIDIH
jgi:hypothetical protein